MLASDDPWLRPISTASGPSRSWARKPTAGAGEDSRHGNPRQLRPDRAVHSRVLVARLSSSCSGSPARTPAPRRTPTDIIFTGSVSGLSRGASVLYNGLQVGEVTSLYCCRSDPSKVVARVEIDASTPMNVDTRARLEFQGLTGVASIQLPGGGPTARRWTPRTPDSRRSSCRPLGLPGSAGERRNASPGAPTTCSTRPISCSATMLRSINQTVRNVESFAGARPRIRAALTSSCHRPGTPRTRSRRCPSICRNCPTAWIRSSARSTRRMSAGSFPM